MKAIRFLRALTLALLLIAPARADQGTIVGPLVGPKTMPEVMTTINGALLAIQSCNSGSAAPANGPGAAPKAFQCWADTSAAPVITYKTYDGTSWVAFGQLNTSTHVWTPYRNGALIAAVATSSSATDLTTGTLPAARLPVPTASTLGGVQSKTCSASQWLNEITTSGVPNCAQPNFTDVAGTAALAQIPAFSGLSAASAAADADTFPTSQGAGNLKQTLAAIKTWIKGWVVKADVALGNVDNTSDATKWSATKTLLNTTYNCGSTGNICTVRLGSDITGFGTGVAAALGVNIGSAGAPLLFNGAGGTPSSMVGTNITGTASGLTSGNVITNANLTGEVTSVGNAATVTNSSVIGKVLTAFSASAGTVSSSDSILAAFQKIVGNIALKANSSSPVFSGVSDNQGTLKLSSFVTSTQITANQNDYTATDGSNTCSAKTSLRISTNASRNITGLSCGQAEGDIRIIHNVGSFSAVLTNQDAGSIAANRFLLGGDMTLAADTSVTIKYDGVAGRWRAITTPGAGGGGGGVTSVTVAPGSGARVDGTCTITGSGTCTVTPVIRGHIAGLTLSTGGSSSTFSISPGVATDSTSSDTLVQASGFNKTTSSWAVGSGSIGSLDTGPIANNTGYHVFIIKRPDTGVVDYLTSLSPTAPTLPTNYTLFRRIGSLRTNGAAQWVSFTQLGDEFLWLTPIYDVQNANPGTTPTLYSLTVPAGVQVNALVNIGFTNTVSTAVSALVSSPDMGVQAAGSPVWNVTVSCLVAGLYNSAQGNIRTNTSGQVRAVASTASSNGLLITTYGWIDRRGRD
jgi:hypothetical protein